MSILDASTPNPILLLNLIAQSNHSLRKLRDSRQIGFNFGLRLVRGILIDVPVPRIFTIIITNGGNIIHILFQKGDRLSDILASLPGEIRDGKFHIRHIAERSMILIQLIQALCDDGLLLMEFYCISIQLMLCLFFNGNFSICLRGNSAFASTERMADIFDYGLLVGAVAVKL